MVFLLLWLVLLRGRVAEGVLLFGGIPLDSEFLQHKCFLSLLYSGHSDNEHQTRYCQM